MKLRLTLFITILVGLSLMATSSFAATNQASISKEHLNPHEAVEKSQKEQFFVKRITKKAKKWFTKWEDKSKKAVDDEDDDIGVWTWVSMGLLAAATLFPPFALIALITSLIAMRKNKKKENLGDLDWVLALTSFILAIIGSLVTGLLVLLILAGTLEW